MSLSDKLSIDGSDLNNLGRYFNHKCPNNNFETIRIGDIHENEELTFSYEQRYWINRTCSCGITDCYSRI